MTEGEYVCSVDGDEVGNTGVYYHNVYRPPRRCFPEREGVQKSQSLLSERVFISCPKKSRETSLLSVYR